MVGCSPLFLHELLLSTAFPDTNVPPVTVCMRWQETAVNIGFACSLLRMDMALYRVSAEVQAVVELEDAGRAQEVGSLPFHMRGLALEGISTQATRPVNPVCEPRCSRNSSERLRRDVTKCAGSCVGTKPSAALCSCEMLTRASNRAAADMLAKTILSLGHERHVRSG